MKQEVGQPWTQYTKQTSITELSTILKQDLNNYIWSRNELNSVIHKDADKENDTAVRELQKVFPSANESVYSNGIFFVVHIYGYLYTM